MWLCGSSMMLLAVAVVALRGFIMIIWVVYTSIYNIPNTNWGASNEWDLINECSFQSIEKGDCPWMGRSCVRSKNFTKGEPYPGWVFSACAGFFSVFGPYGPRVNTASLLRPAKIKTIYNLFLSHEEGTETHLSSNNRHQQPIGSISERMYCGRYVSGGWECKFWWLCTLLAQNGAYLTILPPFPFYYIANQRNGP